MASNQILALSSSRVGNNGYLEKALPLIEEFLGNTPLRIAFIPFAAVDADYNEYSDMVRAALKNLPHQIETVEPANATSIISNCDAIMTGGGNTFKLLHDIYENKLLDLLRDKVNKGTPYIGWSAGANILGPGIGTTNDMPVIMPKSFDALGLLPFQINPHYYNQKPEGFNGETRDQRLFEFMKMNPGLSVVGLPEGTALVLRNNLLQLAGAFPAVLFEAASQEPVKRQIEVGTNLSFLL